MSALGQLEKLLTTMTRAEKAQVLQWELYTLLPKP